MADQYKKATKTCEHIGPLRVVLTPPRKDETSWFAQGLEVDYGAQGETTDEAINNFLLGLRGTIELNHRMYGHVHGVTKPAEKQHWDFLLENTEKITSVLGRPLDDDFTKEIFPYGRADFFEIDKNVWD